MTGKADPVVNWLLRYRTGLREGGQSAEHEVLATYWTKDGEAPFAFCRHGLLIKPNREARYVPFVSIKDAGYYNRDMIERAKRARYNRVSAPLIIMLQSGESIELPVDVRDDGMPDLLTIAKLIHQRVVIHRQETENP